MLSLKNLVANVKIEKLKNDDILLLEPKCDCYDRIINSYSRSRFTHTAMLAINGNNNKAISRALLLSLGTIMVRLSTIFQTLGTSNKVDTIVVPASF